MELPKFDLTHTERVKSQSKYNLPIHAPGHLKHPHKLTEAEIQTIHNLMKTMLKNREPRQFQLDDVVIAQEERRDALCHAATGMGKTAIAAAPHIIPQNKGRITIMVSPLITLQNEMMDTFKNECGVKAIAVNSTYDGYAPKLITDILPGKYQIILISPEMLLSRPFMNAVIRNPIFARRVYACVVDEVHCVLHWGASFRKKYASLGIIQAFLPRNTPFIALSASLTPRVIRDIKEKLQLSNDCLHCNIGNNRSNVSLVVRCIHNPMQLFTNLDFVIPKDATSLEDIPKTWIYVDNIAVGGRIVDHLLDLLPKELQGAVRSYNAILSAECRTCTMQSFKDGLTRVLVCTDAAGMGCNIPDIDVVVQWKLPEKLSSFVQRAGRAARGPDTEGIAILLVEPSAYSVMLPENEKEENSMPSKSKSAKERNQQLRTQKKSKVPKGYALARGRARGNHTQKDVLDTTLTPLPVNSNSTNKSLHYFIQATTCRQDVIKDVYKNPDSESVAHVKCCDICNPELLDKCRPPPLVKSRKTVKLPDNPESDKVADTLKKWRKHTFVRDFKNPYTSAAVLPDYIIKQLSSSYHFEAKSIETYLKPQWALWSRYGQEVIELLIPIAIDIPIAPASKRKGKRPVTDNSRTDDTAPAARKRKTLVKTSVNQTKLTTAGTVGDQPSNQDCHPLQDFRSSQPVALPAIQSIAPTQTIIRPLQLISVQHTCTPRSVILPPTPQSATTYSSIHAQYTPFVPRRLVLPPTPLSTTQRPSGPAQGYYITPNTHYPSTYESFFSSFNRSTPSQYYSTPQQTIPATNTQPKPDNLMQSHEINNSNN